MRSLPSVQYNNMEVLLLKDYFTFYMRPTQFFATRNKKEFHVYFYQQNVLKSYFTYIYINVCAGVDFNSKFFQK